MLFGKAALKATRASKPVNFFLQINIKVEALNCSCSGCCFVMLLSAGNVISFLKDSDFKSLCRQPYLASHLSRTSENHHQTHMFVQ